MFSFAMVAVCFVLGTVTVVNGSNGYKTLEIAPYIERNFFSSEARSLSRQSGFCMSPIRVSFKTRSMGPMKLELIARLDITYAFTLVLIRVKGPNLSTKAAEAKRCVKKHAQMCDFPCAREEVNNCNKLPGTTVFSNPGVSPGAAKILTPISLSKVSVGARSAFKLRPAVPKGSGTRKEDFYMLFYDSPSMYRELSSFCMKCLLQFRTKSSSDVRFGLGTYSSTSDKPFRNLQSLASDGAKLTRAFEKIHLETNRPGNNPSLFALSKVATLDSIGRRNGSRKILVQGGNYPGAEPICPTGEETITRRSVIRQLTQKMINVVSISGETVTSAAPGGGGTLNLPTSSSSSRDRFKCKVQRDTRAGQASDIATGTNGVYVADGSEARMEGPIIRALLVLKQILDADTSDCEGKLRVTFSPQLPLDIQSGAAVEVTERVEILRGACLSRRQILCKIVFTLSGVPRIQVLRSTKEIDCD